MYKDLGQDEIVWSNEWEKLTPESEIQMWDFFGLRQWISKFIPRYGKTIEAGCGLGRYVFYFSRMGIDIDGIDFSLRTIEYLNRWKMENGFDVIFKNENIVNLGYDDDSLSGYISLGVIEHFIEGPEKVLNEAYRVLRPGGIAIISTPSISFYIFYQKLKKLIKNTAKTILIQKKSEEPFFQYWYRPRKLKKFIESTGFKVSIYRSADLFYAFCELGNYSLKYINENSFGYRFANKNETSFLRFLGAQSITISVKVADKMFCFLCGEYSAKETSLRYFDVPICTTCADKKISDYYRKNKIAKYCTSYIMNPPIKSICKSICDFCHKEYTTDKIFEDYGFCKNVCNDCLKIPINNIILTNDYVKPIWRKRINS